MSPDRRVNFAGGTPLGEKARQVWRRVAAAGSRGVGHALLADQLAGVVDDGAPLAATLRGLTGRGLVKFLGSPGSTLGVYVASGVPLGEDRPGWMTRYDDGEPPEPFEADPPPMERPPLDGGPMSVFTPAGWRALQPVLSTRQAKPSAELVLRPEGWVLQVTEPGQAEPLVLSAAATKAVALAVGRHPTARTAALDAKRKAAA